MGDAIERYLEEAVPLLRAAQRAKLLTPSQTRDIVRRRRDHEYTLCTPRATRVDYLRYASYERMLAAQLHRRATRAKLRKRRADFIVGKSRARVNLVYSRAVHRFPGDVDLWLHYARHCVETGGLRAAGRVLGKALAMGGGDERVWMAAVAFHFDTCQDVVGGRALAQRAIRACGSGAVWREYYRLEVCYLAKLVARRLAMGLQIPGEGLEAVEKVETVEPVEPVEGGEQVRWHGVEGEQGKKGTDGEVGDGLENWDKALSDGGDEASSGEDSVAASGDTLDDEEEQAKGIAEGDGEGHGKGNGQVTEASLEGVWNVGDIKEQEVGKLLSFWEGGVPMTVFRNACEKVKLTPKDRVDFYNIAASTPYVPSKLLISVSEWLHQRFPECAACRMVSLRLPWDLDHTRFRLDLVQEAKGNDQKGNDGLPISSDAKKRKAALAKSALHMFPSMKQALVESTASLDDSVKVGVLACVESFGAAATDVDLSGRSAAEVKRLTSAVMSGILLDNESGAAERKGDEKSCATGVREFSVKELYRLVVQQSCTLSNLIYESMRRHVVVPFRGLDEEMILSAWILRERDLGRLRKLTDDLLLLPPLTMQSVRACIAAELRLWAQKEKGVEATDADQLEVISRVRTLFMRAATLGSSKRDVDFWLEYVDFERKIACDAKQSSMAAWKASKRLDPRNAELFNERQTLRNLS